MANRITQKDFDILNELAEKLINTKDRGEARKIIDTFSKQAHTFDVYDDIRKLIYEILDIADKVSKFVGRSKRKEQIVLLRNSLNLLKINGVVE